MKLSTEVSRGARDITLASRVFLVVAVVSLVLSAVLLAQNQGVFTPTIRAYLITASAEGMNKGMAVKLVGFRVGSVRGISIEADRNVKVELDIIEKYAPMIFANATVRLTREAVIGGNVLEVRPGTENTGAMRDRAVLRFERDPGIEGSVTKLLDQLAPIVVDIRQITTYLNNPEGDFRQAISNVNKAAGSLAVASADFRKLVGTAEDRVARGETQLSKVFGTAEKLLHQANDSLELFKIGRAHV